MLTTDLLRVRTYKGEVRPRWVDPDDPEHLALAARLIAIFDEHRGRTRGELAAELADFLGAGTAFLLHRGLAKLLEDRSEFATDAAAEPGELRAAAFAAAAATYRAPRDEDDPHPFHFDREAVLARAAGEFGVAPEELAAGLYADLKDEQVLTAFDPPQPRRLLERYNVALAQAVLLRATELTLRLRPQDPRSLRALFGRIKFFQLLHRVEPQPDGGWVIHLDGPLSLFQSSQRYGLKMASFLPTLLHFDGWQLTASLAWGTRRRRRTFRLAATDGLRPQGQLPGRWQPEELTAFAAAFARLDSAWEIAEGADVVPLGGQGILIPDFVFRHPESGTRVVMEVLGFWRRGAVASRLKLLRRHGPDNLILAVSRQLAAGAEDLDRLPGEVYVFRRLPLAREVLKRLEAMRPAGERP